ncbi:hypothetical protein CP97_14805 [Aurantiacibacter atlanticus]|uniref:Uncharacterized protein n=1 Tax=Aurantiacibacter atlanticus TaxID=1648404 RepID=A0A161I497_9SPHN|nr:hypothetical protein [Aurantiacibacter atlanticus]ANC50491.1 hypothetical protein CP97_14805 [Aurantiacibacter atlanticus]MDF1835138.1 hypothetical protein [Alteraurantiacibacter sp. bin_em_oilr2.035]
MYTVSIGIAVSIVAGAIAARAVVNVAPIASVMALGLHIFACFAIRTLALGASIAALDVPILIFGLAVGAVAAIATFGVSIASIPALGL